MKKLFLLLFMVCPTCAQAQTDTLYNGHYTVVYSYVHNEPILVSWKLYKKDLIGNAKRSGLSFKSDKRLKKPRVTSADYTNSGYQRGHMCPAADWPSDKRKMKATFLMSNVTPQAPALNTGKWKQDEILSRYYALQYDSVLIQCAPYFLRNTTKKIGKRNVSIPDGFWKSVRLLSSDSILFTHYYENK